MLQELEVGYGVEAPDGRYTRGQVHAIGGKYGAMMQFLPNTDPRFKAVLVKDGMVYAIDFDDGSVPAPAPQPAVAAPAVTIAPVATTEEAENAEKPKPKVFFGKRG